MGHGYKHGASGKKENPLSFEVVSYPSDVELNTATPEVFTIGVVTTNPITGWYFSATQPENMVEGEVWFATGTSSDVAFNALKKNDVHVYPVKATQYVNSELKEVTAKIYQDREWRLLEHEVYLYNGESTGWESCVTPTDGWQPGSMSFSDGAILLDNDHTAAANGAATTIAHDLSKHKSISVTIDSKSTGLDTPNSGVWVCVATTNDFSWNPGAEGNGMGLPSGIVASKIISTTGTVTLDISSFPGSYYVAILASRNKKIYCTKVKLTK